MIDLSRLNQFVLCPHFKMETLNSIRLALQKGDWVTSLDLRDAYFHIGIHRRSRRYLRFVFEGKVYQFQALAFGLNVSLYVFTRMLKTVLRHVRRLGIRVHAYLDNWLQPSVSETLSWLHSRRLLKIILDLARLHSQLGEVRTSSSPGFLFPGGQIQAGSSSYRPISGQHCLYSTGSSQASGSQTSLSTSIILHSRSNGVNGQSSTTRESFQEISSVGTQREVVSKACLVGHQYSSRTVVCLGSRSMDGFGLFDIHVSPSSSFSSTPSLHRFELGGLGGSY